MDACTIDEDKAHPQAIILYFVPKVGLAFITQNW